MKAQEWLGTFIGSDINEVDGNAFDSREQWVSFLIKEAAEQGVVLEQIDVEKYLYTDDGLLSAICTKLSEVDAEIDRTEQYRVQILKKVDKSWEQFVRWRRTKAVEAACASYNEAADLVDKLPDYVEVCSSLSKKSFG